MTFSIIMPIYDVEKYLNQSIQSVLTQSFKDFELILIDDASPDQCGAICDAFAEKDSRIRLVHNRHNLGVCKSRNIGIDLAKGHWIWFVDPDDKIGQNALATLHDCLPTECDVIFFGFQYVIEANDLKKRAANISMPVHTPGSSQKEIAEFVLKNDLKHTLAPLWNKLYRRDFLLAHHITFSDTTLEDAFFNFNVFSYTSQIKTTAACLYFYLRRKSGSLSKQKAWNRMDIYKKRYRAVLHLLKQKDALTVKNHAMAFYCHISRLFYVLYVAITAKK